MQQRLVLRTLGCDHVDVVINADAKPASDDHVNGAVLQGCGDPIPSTGRSHLHQLILAVTIARRVVARLAKEAENCC